jgi:hypothetical protein
VAARLVAFLEVADDAGELNAGWGVRDWARAFGLVILGNAEETRKRGDSNYGRGFDSGAAIHGSLLNKHNESVFRTNGTIENVNIENEFQREMQRSSGYAAQGNRGERAQKSGDAGVGWESAGRRIDN